MSPALERGLDAPQWVDTEIASFSFPYFFMSEIALRPQQGTFHPFHYFSGCPHFTTPVVLTNWYKHQSQLEPLQTCSLPAPVTSPALLYLRLLNIRSDFLTLCLVKFPLLKLPLLSSDAPNGASSECSDPTPGLAALAHLSAKARASRDARCCWKAKDAALWKLELPWWHEVEYLT